MGLGECGRRYEELTVTQSQLPMDYKHEDFPALTSLLVLKAAITV